MGPGWSEEGISRHTLRTMTRMEMYQPPRAEEGEQD